MLEGHAHSEHSFDSKASISGYLDKAVRDGFSYLAITDHFDPDFVAAYSGKIAKGLVAHPGNKIDVDAYYASLCEWQPVAQGRGIDFAKGIEIGWHAGEKPWLKSLPDFDVIINSVHMVETLCPVRNPEYFGDGVEKAIERYIDAVLRSMDLDADWSVLAHFGYPYRFAPGGGFMRYQLFKDGIDEVLAKVIKMGKTLEYNTKVTNDPEMFRRYYELGGRQVSFGADAHAVELLGNKYSDAVKVLSDIGFDHWTMYKNLKPVRYEF